MNKCYKSIYSEKTGTWVAVSELEATKGKKSKSTVTSTSTALATVATALSLAGTSYLFAFSPTAQAVDAFCTNAARTAVVGSAPNAGDEVACGQGAVASGLNSIAIGKNATAQGDTSLAVGVNSLSSGPNTIAIGFSSVSSGTLSLAVGNQAVASAADATALGVSTLASARNSTAVGNDVTASGIDSTAIGGGSVNVSASSSIGAGVLIDVQSSQTTALGSFLGTSATANRSTLLGTQASTEGKQSIVIQSNSGADITAGGQSGTQWLAVDTASTNAIAVGTTSSVRNSAAAIALGKSAQVLNANNGVAIGTSASANATNAVAIGNIATANGVSALAAGDRSIAASIDATAIGRQATASGSGAVAIGTTAKAINNQNNIAIGYGAIATAASDLSNDTAIGESSMAIGEFALASQRNSYALGTNSRALAEGAQAFGNSASASGVSSIAIGANSSASGAGSSAFGQDATATAEGTVAFGRITTASGVYATAIGDFAKATQASATAIGDSSSASGLNSTAIGAGASATLDDSVAVGSGAITLAAVPTNSATVGGITYGGFAGSTSTKVFSVGSSATDTRQIQFVSAGQISATSTDAINGSQLFATQGVINNVATTTAGIIGGTTTVNPDGKLTTGPIGGTTQTTISGAINEVRETPLNFAGNMGDTISKKLGDTLNIVGGLAPTAAATAANTRVDSEDGKLVVKMAKDLTDLTSVTTTDADGNQTVVNGSGLTITNADGSTGPSITNTGIDAGDLKVTNVADGLVAADSKDAVNGSQLYATEQKGLNFTDSNGIVTHKNLGETLGIIGGGTKADSEYSATNIKTTTDADGNIVVNMDKNLTDLESVTTADADGNQTVVNGSGLTIINADGSTGPSITNTGIDAGGLKVTNVADGTIGEGSKDAVNGGQLYQTTVDLTNIGLKFAGNTGDTVHKALGETLNIVGGLAAGAATTDANTRVDSEDGQLVVKMAKDLTDLTSVTTTDVSGNTSVLNGAGLTSTDFAGNQTVVNGTGVATKDVAGNSTVMNGAGITTTDFTGNKTVINGNGLTVVNNDGSIGPSITNAGVDAGGLKVTNVADGTIGEGSKDAVNGGQLHQTTVDLTNLGLNFVDNNGTVTHKNLGETLGIVGGGTKADSEYSSSNIKTTTDADGNVVVMMDKNLNADSLTLNGKDGVDGQPGTPDLTITGATGPAGVNGAPGETTTRIVYDDGTGPQQVATLNDGLKFAGNQGDVIAKKLNETLTVKGGLDNDADASDANLRVDSEDGNLVVKMAKDLTDINSVTLGNTVLNQDGLTVGGANGPSITTAGINAGGTTITNVAAGQAPTDAVNVSQLKDAAAAATTEVKAADGDKNVSVTSATADDGHTIYSVGVSRDLNVDSVTLPNADGSSTNLTAGGLSFKDADGNATGPSVTANGIDAGDEKITNVAAGDISADSKDAVNGSQLYGLGNNITNIFGGNASYAGDQIVWNNIGGTGQNTIDDAIKYVNDQAANANQGWNIATDSGTANTSTVKPGDTVNINGDTASGVTVTNNGNNITVGLSDKVNVGDKVSIDGTTGTINAGNVTINGEAGTVNGLTNTTWNPDNIVSGQAATEDQLAQVAQNASNQAAASKTEVTQGNNIVVTSSTADDGHTVYNVATADDVKFNSVDATTVTAGSVSVGNVTIDQNGINAGGQKVTNVAPGTVSSTSTDAVNGSQLYTTNQNIANYLGGGSTVDANGNTTAPTYNVSGGSYNNVGDALGAIDNRVTTVQNNLEQAFSYTNNRINKLEDKMSAGIAATAALENAPYVPGKWTYAAGAAYYNDQSAVGVTLRRTADNGRWSLNGGVAGGTTGSPLFRIGVSGVID